MIGIGLKWKVILGALIILGGSGVVAYQTGIISVPEFGVQDRGDWTEVSDDKIGVKSTAWVHNDNPVKLNFSQLELKYKLRMNGIKLAEGMKEGIAIDKGNQTLNIETSLYQQKLPKWWVSHIRNGEKTNIQIQFGVRRNILGFPLKVNGISYGTEIETNLEKTISKAMDSMKGNYSGPAIAGIEGTSTDIQIKGGSAKFGKVTKDRTVVDAKVKIHNPNSYPIPTPHLSGDMSLNQIQFADISTKPVRSLENAKIDPGETKTVNFKAEIDNTKVDDWLTAHIRDQERSNGNVQLYLVFDLTGTEFKIPTADCSFEVQTAIFEDGQNSSSSFESCEVAGQLSTEDKNSSDSSGSLVPLEDGNTSGDLNPIPGTSETQLLKAGKTRSTEVLSS